jgi:hypothetical protein
MNATEKRLTFALLFAAGIIIFNVYMVVSGAADRLYDQLPGTAPQHETQVLVLNRIAVRQTCQGERACRNLI